jgi:hypothetical protein
VVVVVLHPVVHHVQANDLFAAVLAGAVEGHGGRIFLQNL